MVNISNANANALFPVHPELSGVGYDLQLLSDSIIGSRAIKGYMTKTVLPINRSSKSLVAQAQNNQSQGSGIGSAFGYLPILKVMSPETYTELNTLAPYTAWVQETLADYVGKVFANPPNLIIPDALAAKLQENGIDLASVAKNVFTVVCAFGRVVIEAIPMESGVALNIRPSYEARNWGPQDTFGRVPWCILENYDFEAKEDYEQIRADFANVWKKKDGGVELSVYKESKDSTPTVYTWSDLDDLPVVSINMNGLCWLPTSLPLSDIAYLNLSHYQLAAALKLKLYRGVVSVWYKSGDEGGGEEASDDKIFAGPSGVVSTGPGGSVGVAEETGAMVAQLRESISEVREELSQLGAVSMRDAKKGAETAETARLRLSTVHTRIRGILSACTMGMTELIVILGKVFGMPVESSPELFAYNRELGDIPVTKDEIDRLIELLDEGLISRETVVRALFERGALPLTLDLETALKDAEEAMPEPEPPPDPIPDPEPPPEPVLDEPQE